MKKLFILTFIFSITFLASCGKEIEYKKLTDEEITKRIDMSNKYLKMFKINGNSTGTISAKWNGETLNTSGFNCENIIPLLEYEINWYNNEIGYLGEHGEFEKNKGIYDGYFLVYDGFIKLNFKEKDESNICLYGASFLNNTGAILDNTDKTIGIYKNGVFEYKDNFGFSKYFNGLPKTKNKISSMGFSYGDTMQNRITNNDGDYYFDIYSIGGSIQLMFPTDITGYLQYLEGISKYNNSNEELYYDIDKTGIKTL